jgi:hypothetical protein
MKLINLAVVVGMLTLAASAQTITITHVPDENPQDSLVRVIIKYVNSDLNFHPVLYMADTDDCQKAGEKKSDCLVAVDTSSVQHAYQPGIYTIRMSAMDKNNHQVMATRKVKIAPPVEDTP